MKIKTYKDAGVDIDKGDAFVEFIKKINSKAVSKGIGGFAGGVRIDVKKYKNPIMMSTTDGVGTKLLVAKKFKKYDTIGIDLVAMCVNDLAVCGCFPEVFLDYIACGKIHEKTLQEIMKGIVAGCEQAECTLAGGETAEMPDLYAGDDFDLAGFSVGIADRDEMLPKTEKITEGDVILGLPSSGIHSNGLSMARKVMKTGDIKSWKDLLIPTKIYVKELKTLLKTKKILAAAHITGGGLINNLQRVIPANLKPKYFFNWEVPEIFNVIRKNSNASQEEMQKVFNLGIGVSLIVKSKDISTVLQIAKKNEIKISAVGELIHG